MSIKKANPSFKQVNVEIYSISGQKIKTLLKTQKGAKSHAAGMAQMKVDNGYHMAFIW